MPRMIACPKEADLLALAAGDDPPARLLAHLDSCPRCRVLTRRLRAEILCLRSCRGPVSSPPTAVNPRGTPNGG